jgi:hypothetical protein
MRRRDVLRAGAATLSSVGVGSATAGRTGAADDGFEPLGRLALPGAKELVVDDGIAYVATTDGFATVDITDPAAPELLAERRNLLPDHPDGPLADVFDGKFGGGHYALAGPGEPLEDAPYAAVVFDVADPADPERILVHETEFFHHNLDTDGETLYLCGNDGDRNPLVCVDVETGREAGRWSVLDADDRWAEAHPSLRQIHDVWVADGVAYCSYWEAGTWLVDVSDPADPTALVGLRGRDPEAMADIDSSAELREARFTRPGNDHFAVPQRGADGPLLALNEEAWAADEDAGVDALGGVELWDREAGERLSRIEAPPTDDPTFGGTWTTAHNFDLVGDRLYTSWYRGGVKVHDVSDPTAPRELGHWRDSATTDFWTAQGAGDHVVASSWRDVSADRPEEGAAIYTFPAVEDATPTQTPTPTPAATEETGTGTPTSAGDGSGFGAAVGAAGLGLAALARRLRD